MAIGSICALNLRIFKTTQTEAIMKALLRLAILASLGTACEIGAYAQTEAQGSNTKTRDQRPGLDLLRKIFVSQKKAVGSGKLKLTDAEATKFWPVYDRTPLI